MADGECKRVQQKYINAAAGTWNFLIPYPPWLAIRHFQMHRKVSAINYQSKTHLGFSKKILILFSGNRQIPGLATGAVGHSLFYSRR
jgi:hypothetical protein